MAPYDDWNAVDDEEDEELQDLSELHEDPEYEDTKTCHLLTALAAAVQIQKKKVIVGPNDVVGIMLFNTVRPKAFFLDLSSNGTTFKTRKTVTTGIQSELKKNTFAYQPISPLSAPTIQELVQLLDDAREDPEALRKAFPPLQGKRVPMGDVFTSFVYSAPKTATKRVFLITDEDNPHSGPGSQQLITSARTTLIDLTQAGVTVEPFFISTPDKPFDVTKFYSSVLLPSNLVDDDEDIDPSDPSVLPESISITRIEDLLAQMRFREVPKRAHYSVPFKLGEGLTIGVKGYGLVTEQKKGAYKYFVDLGDRMEVATTRTVYVDQAREAEVERTKILYGTSLGETVAAVDEENEDEDEGIIREVPLGKRPFYTAEDIRSFRTMGLEPGIKLLGFKDRSELAFEDNIKHSHFIYPDEMTYAGSKRTFSALIKSLVKKKKMGLVLALTRRNATPAFCALLPQEEKADEAGWVDPAGFHLIPLPFADDIRAATVTNAMRVPVAASDPLKDAARAWIDKLSVKNGAYPPDSYPNPALAYHNAQLEASAFREEFDSDSLRSTYESGSLGKMRVDQLKDFLRSKSQPVSGKKAELMERVTTWFDEHP
ncbi:hypothetical protein C0993_001573 [Termitomyces sp. T159_Od127]|nr:hypothetical protein C0993_001573 [Termitomyces sp. T159_Od127]